MVVIMLAQTQMAFNITALPVSIGGIVESFSAPATTISTALVLYSLCVAAFVLIGARIGRLAGERLTFQIGVAVHGAAMAAVALSVGAGMLYAGQVIAGLAAAVLVPSLVVLIAANYRGKQQAQCLGLLAGTPAIASVLAFAIAGFLGSVLTWRLSFALLAVLAVAVVALSFRLEPIRRNRSERIDFGGAAFAAATVILFSLGLNFLNDWGPLLERADAPFGVIGLSPAPFLVIGGMVFGQAFFVWSHRRQSRRTATLISLEVLDSRTERRAVIAMLMVGGLGAAVDFLIPLYVQIVQGRDSLETAIAAIPYTLTVFASAVFIVRLYDRFSSRQIAVAGFGLVAAGLTMLAFSIGNDWGTPTVIASLLVLGTGEGALLTLLFNVLVSESPKRLAGDVGALRGTANNLSTAVGTSVATLLSISLLSLIVANRLASTPALPQQLQDEIPLDKVDFVSNDQLTQVLSETSATPEQVATAVEVNTDARLQALRESFLILAAVGLLAILPSLGLPRYSPSEVPDPDEEHPPDPAKITSFNRRNQ